MVAHYCLFYVLLTLLCFTDNIYGVSKIDCSDTCSCLGYYVDCAKRSLDDIPRDIPNWVKDLDLSNNNLKGNISDPLTKLTHLAELKLNHNSLRTIPYLNIPSLRRLGLSHNELTILNGHSLRDLPALQDIDLNNNKIDKIQVNSFSRDNKIRILNINSNQIKVLENGTLENLTSLTELKLNRNKISVLNVDVFRNLRSLKLLELNGNKLKEIKGLVFQGLEELTTLKLRRNHITQLKDGALFGLSNITFLQLDYNYITTVQKAGFYGVSTLSSLFLSHNRITRVEDGGWQFCNQLQELDMSFNNLTEIRRGTFEHLSNLKRLRLNGNKIASIEEGAFLYTQNLERLDLSNNRISWTIEDQNGPFLGLSKLSIFNLAYNHIKSINQNAFVGLKMLSELDLSNNNITSIHDNAFLTLTHVQDLIINTTNLLCDCNLQWLNVWLQDNPHLSEATAICAYPVWLRGKSLRSLQTENFTCDDSPKPRITDEPKPQMVLKGSNVSLVCKARSSVNAAMTFLWKLDNLDLKGAKVNETLEELPDGKSTEARSEFFLVNVTHYDAGEYQCVVENSYGTTYSQRSKIVVVTFPSFVKIPTDVTVKSGSTARLECAAKGQPQPQIAWQKDGGNDFPAARERRMRVMPDDDVFFIINAKTADMGVYSCTATNLAGVIYANAKLTILETPSFVKPMENKDVTAGDAIVLECMASGSPKPNLRWLKDNAPLKGTERHFFTAEDQLLIIMETSLSDAGTYECEMTNSLGTERGFTQLRVNPAISSGVNEHDMWGIIVITVVCCAVGTSIVWVAIIYQTRKRKPIPTTSELIPALTEIQEETPNVYTDTVSEHSSCKDSGTGDSAKRSNDDLLPPDAFQVIIPDSSIQIGVEQQQTAENTTNGSYSHPRPTNHKRLSQGSIQSADLDSLSENNHSVTITPNL